MPSDFRALDRQLCAAKERRLPREAEWQQIADVFMPRKDFTMARRTGELRRRRLSSSIPPVSLRRGAGLLVAYLIDHTRPFIGANMTPGLIQAGRQTSLDDASRDYVSNLEWSIFDRMMLPRSSFLSSVSRMALELCGFGTGVVWTGRKPGFGPRYLARPLRACWIEENEENEVDTLFYEFCMPLWRAVQRWPDHGIKRWREDMGDDAKSKRQVEIIHAVYPRRDGSYGAVAERKPFAEEFWCVSEKALLAESGYDSFPYAVPRLDVEEGSAYGTGMAWHVLPEALVLNSLVTGVELGVELKLQPPLFHPARMFAKPIDRRPGAVNLYDAAGLGFQNANQAFQRLDLSGDVNVGQSYAQWLGQNIEQAFFVDWMRLRDSGTMTAEEVRERRDLRIRAMSAFVPYVDRDLMGVLADRTVEIMDAEAQLAPPPAQLAGVDLNWDFKGPLAIAQLKAQAQSVSDLFDITLKAAELDPLAPYALAVEEGVRSVAEALGAPPEVVRSREATAAARAQAVQQQNDQHAMEQTQGAATSLRDAGQGVASLAGAAGQPQQQAA